MDAVRNFFSPVKQHPNQPAPEPQSPSEATTPWSKNIKQARNSLGRIDSPSGIDRTRSIASPAAIVSAKYAHHDVDDVDESKEFEEHTDDVGMTGADAAPAFFTDLPLTSPQARRSVPTAVASNNPVADADKMETEEGEKEDEDEQYSFTRFLDHRQTGNDNDIEILVEWDQGSPTWEPETNLHHDAPDTLFAYWKSQGGRPLNPEDPDLFEIYAIRKHSKNKKRLQVEWLGYDKSEWTWLPSSVVEETAREVVEAYWRDQKGK